MIGPAVAAACGIAFCCALGGCNLLRKFAIRKKLLDQPNERSLHQTPMPRLGGVAIVTAVCVGLAVLATVYRRGPERLTAAWLLSSLPIAALGLVDDLRPLSARARLFWQVAAATLFCVVAGIPPCLPVYGAVCAPIPPFISLAGGVLFIVATLNIFNFMDGMDGLAGVQAVGAALGIGYAFAAVHQMELTSLCALVAAASGGFLVSNAPPAKIFMGDTGSTFLGFTFAALAVAGADLRSRVPLPVFLLALAPFLRDGGSALMRRALRGESLWKAHREHLYQRAVISGCTQQSVLVVYGSWISAASVAAALAIAEDLQQLIGMGLGMVASLVLVRSWVSRSERVALRRSGRG